MSGCDWWWRRADGVPAGLVSRGHRKRRALRAATASLLARDVAHACSHRSRALLLVLGELLSRARDQYQQQSAGARFGRLLVSL